MSSALRRLLLLVMFVSAVAAATTWWRERSDDDEAPVWPPLEPRSDASGPGDTGAVDAAAATETWRAAADGDTSAPVGFPIKAKESSGIFHVPGGRFYDRTKPDRWYATADAAEADGYRRSKT